MSIEHTYDRDGQVIPDDWYDATKYPRGKAKWNTQQRVGRTVLTDGANDGTVVSTVWLMGIDHSYEPDGPPIIFETMIFGGQSDQELRRYATEEQAMRGHLEAVDNLRAGKRPWWAQEAS
ncbi:hypothetical protein PJP13_24240 [Mycobacterium kansasii]